jgi:hypothetical protein
LERGRILKVNQEKVSKRLFFLFKLQITQTEIKHIMSFINSIIKVFVGDKSQKMSKFTTVLNKIKTFETANGIDRLRTYCFFKDRINNTLIKTLKAAQTRGRKH